MHHLPRIELEAGELFRDGEMDVVADGAPPTLDALRAYVQRSSGWVAMGGDEGPVGYRIADVVDDEAHIAQVSVLPSYSRRGVGRDLIEQARMWAAAKGLTGMTLTTFTYVAWNGPYYERLGFRHLPDDRVGPELAEIRRLERNQGLDRWPRTCMSRRVQVPLPARGTG